MASGEQRVLKREKGQKGLIESSEVAQKNERSVEAAKVEEEAWPAEPAQSIRACTCTCARVKHRKLRRTCEAHALPDSEAEATPLERSPSCKRADEAGLGKCRQLGIWEGARRACGAREVQRCG